MWCCVCLECSLLDVFFFSSRRRHTRFDCDWSSDVCSSDLSPHWRARNGMYGATWRLLVEVCDGALNMRSHLGRSGVRIARATAETRVTPPRPDLRGVVSRSQCSPSCSFWPPATPQIGRASCRERV